MGWFTFLLYFVNFLAVLTKYSIFGKNNSWNMKNEVTIKDFLHSKPVLTTKEIVAFMRSVDSHISDPLVNWKIHSLHKSGYIQKIGRGFYTTIKKHQFYPEPFDVIPKVALFLNKVLPELNYIIWDTRILSRLTIHQPARFYIILETEKGEESSLYNYLRDSFQNVFLKPDNLTFDLYISDKTDPIIINPMISQSPTLIKDSIGSPALEKILVDIFVDETIFSVFQGSELSTIFKNAFDTYNINMSSMLRYAGRRGSRSELIEFLSRLDTNSEEFHFQLKALST